MPPSSGPTKTTPSFCKMAALRWVAGCSHMRKFIAGATRIFLSVARSRVEARSLARPCAILARMSAVAGATTRRPASRESSIWPMLEFSVSAKRSSKTRFPVKLSTESFVTKRCAASVITARTKNPRSRRRRIRSSALYAAMPPPMMRRMRCSGEAVMKIEPRACDSATGGPPHLKELCHLQVRKGRDCGFTAVSQLTRSGLAAAGSCTAVCTCVVQGETIVFSHG